MKNSRFRKILVSFAAVVCLLTIIHTIDAQTMDGIERARMKSMLDNIKNAIKKDYYDPNFHGIDLETRFKQAKERVEQVSTTGQAFGVIAQVLIEFNDSHLYFLPPATNLSVEYGWLMQMYGDRCLVVAVQPKSDAEAKGLKPGDQILSIEGFHPTRTELWKLDYYYNVISKRQKVKMSVLGPNEEIPRTLEIDSKITQHPKVINWQTIYLDQDYAGDDYSINKFLNIGNILVWKMETFVIDPREIPALVKRAKSADSLVLDLRRNGGGFVKTLEKLAGYIFEKDLKIADLKGRKPMDPQVCKTQGTDVFKGKLIVLVDSKSGSASEIFARLVQLEKRGTVLGDTSAGAVMQSRGFNATSGANDEIQYGASITNADVIRAPPVRLPYDSTRQIYRFRSGEQRGEFIGLLELIPRPCRTDSNRCNLAGCRRV